MRIFLFAAFLVVFVLPLSMLTFSCQHEKFPDDPTIPVDTTPVDTTPVDTTPIDTTVIPVDTTPVDTTMYCDSNTVYFQTQVLPLLRGNCAVIGCHDAITHEKGVILDTYENVMATADVEPFDLNNSELFQRLIETDPDKRMPLAPQPPLPPGQINLIAKWILQGAQDLTCDQAPVGCQTDNVSYSQFVRPVLQTNCQGCHSGSAPSGGVNLTTHAGVQTVALNGRLHGAISWSPGYKKMPFNSPIPLPDCTIEKIKAWIDQGAPNN